MKKTFFSIMALAMAMVSCTNEEIPTPAEQYGYINVNVSNDPLVENVAQTRTEVADITQWVVMAGDIDLTEDNKVPAGEYTVTAKSHADMSAALTLNDNWGAAYYEGAKNVEVTAGQTATANINCGKAKNGRITTSFNLAEVFTYYSITVGNRGLIFNKENENQKAYFAPGEVSYTLKYKYNGGAEMSKTGSVSVVAGTEHIISVSSNQNGTISVNITYDESFEDGADQNINFDAATGNELTE